MRPSQTRDAAKDEQPGAQAAVLASPPILPAGGALAERSVNAAAQTDAAQQVEEHEAPSSNTGVQHNGLASAAGQTISGRGSGPPHASAAEIDAAGVKRHAGEAVPANSKPATEHELDALALETSLVAEALQSPCPPADTQHGIERQQSDVTSLSGLSEPSDVQQPASPAGQQQEPQKLLEMGDADTVVQALEGCGVASKLGPAEAGSPLGAASPEKLEPGEHTLPEASSVQHHAREATDAAGSAIVVAGDVPAGTTARSLLASPTASSAMLSGLGSLGSQASLSALSLDADSMAEPELDQLCLGGLDDQELMTADGALMEGVTDPVADVHVPVGEAERSCDSANDLFGGLSDSEDDFDAAGELSIEPLPAAASLRLPPASAALDAGRLPSPGAAQQADQPGSADKRQAQPAPTSEPFSPRHEISQPDSVGAGAELPRWEAALAAAESVEAELLLGAVVERRSAQVSNGVCAQWVSPAHLQWGPTQAYNVSLRCRLKWPCLQALKRQHRVSRNNLQRCRRSSPPLRRGPQKELLCRTARNSAP